MATSENEGDSQKLRFGPWLIKEINSNKYEGIRWTNEAHTEFRIPWKHNSRRDITNNDNEIFRAWAIASGKYHPNIQDRARWKTNFRCALCSTNMFVMVEDNSKNSDDPHKVYRIKQPLAVATNNAPATANHILQEDKDDKDKLDMRPPTVKVPILSQPTSRIEVLELGQRGEGKKLNMKDHCWNCSEPGKMSQVKEVHGELSSVGFSFSADPSNFTVSPLHISIPMPLRVALTMLLALAT